MEVTKKVKRALRNNEASTEVNVRLAVLLVAGFEISTSDNPNTVLYSLRHLIKMAISLFLSQNKEIVRLTRQRNGVCSEIRTLNKMIRR